MCLAGKTALNTGATRGIGLAFAKAYVAEGAQVVLGDISLDLAGQEAEKIGDSAIAVEMNLTDQSDIDTAIETGASQFGQIDILINNSALFTAAPIVEINRADCDRAFDINGGAMLFTMQAVARDLIDSKISGRTIDMSSQVGRRGEALDGVCCASKAAEINLSQSAGLNLLQHGISVNAIALGVADGGNWMS
jgi:D-sorbitol dehydrogenase (acceptor)